MKKLICCIVLMMFITCPVFAEANENTASQKCAYELELERQLEKESFDYSIDNLTTYSLLRPSHVSADELNTVLLSELSGYGELFLACEEEYGINAIFWAAVAAVESGWGEKCNSSNNYFGWGCKTVFENSCDSILDIGERFSKKYLRADGSCFNGYTVADVNRCYNGRPEWEERILSMMHQMYSDIYSLDKE